MNKIELHSHIMEQSSDSKVSASEYIRLLENRGYKVLVTTDHYLSSELQKTEGDGILEKNRNWLKGYYACKNAAYGTDIHVLLGMEYTLEYHSEFIDILLYGITEELLLKGVIRPFLKEHELRDLCHQYDILMIQAHPERYGHHRMCIGYVDGYEIMNTKIRDKYINGYNEKIQEYVKDKPYLISTGGSDSHMIEDVGKGGITTWIPISTMEELKRVLRTREYQIIYLDDENG